MRVSSDRISLLAKGVKLKRCDIYDATHIETRDRRIHRIAEKWGVGPDRRLAKPSEGGFGCITDTGERISMWDAVGYYQETKDQPFMSTWVIYDHPRDFPNKFVARRHDIYRGDPEPHASEEYVTADTLDEIRELIYAKNPNLCCLPRFENDDKNIVEVWL
jgi:hypothetical protein